MKKFACLFIAVLLIVSACTKKEEMLTGEQGGKLIIGTTDLPAVISPLAPSVFGSNDVLMHLHHIDPETGKMKPELAVSWEFSEDLTSITYYLRTDVTWWDGEPVTAADVYFTYEKMLDPKTNYPDIARLRFIEDVEVIGPYAIKFKFNKIYADLLTDSDIIAVPKHGPYKIKEWLPGSGLILTYNDAYYRGRPPLDEVHIRYYADMNKMMEDFSTGNLDLVFNITPVSAKELANNKNINRVIRLPI